MTSIKNREIKTFLILAAIFLFEIALHLSSGGVFVLDDRQIQESSGIKQSLVAYLQTSPFRAATYATYYAIHKIGGLNPQYYHIANLISHLTVSLLIFLIVCELRPSEKNKSSALIASGWFALNPVLNASVFYISAMASVLVVLFTLAMTLAYLRFAQKGKPLFLILSILFMTLALFSKENGIAAPAILVVLSVIYPRKSRRALTITPAIIIAALFVYFRFNFTIDLGNDADIMTPYQYFLTQTTVIPRYFFELLWPRNLALEQNVTTHVNLFDPPVIFGALGMFAVWLYGLWRFRSSKTILFFLIWAPITLAPESSFIPLSDKIFLHRAYMPSVAMAAILGFAGAGLIRSLDTSAEKRTALILSLVVLLCFSITNFKAAASWKSDVKVFQYCVRVAPGKWRAQYDLATVLIRRKRVDEAQVHIEKALELKPKHSYVNNNMGLLLYYQGNIEEAIQYYLKAIEYDPKNSEAYFNLAFAYVQMKDWDKAIEYFSGGLKHEPNNAPAHYNLGMAYLTKNDPDSAIRELKAALEISPDYAIANETLRYALQMKKSGSTPPPNGLQ